MRRGTPWLIALGCVLAGGILWTYRVQKVRAETRKEGRDLVARAWTGGRRVALEGTQTVQIYEGVPKPLRVEAEVLTSGTGSKRIRFKTEPLEGVTIWEHNDQTYRFSPKRKRLTVAHRRDSLADSERLEPMLVRNYDCRVVDNVEVAGRPAKIMELKPKSGAGHWEKLWVDRDTAVILGSEKHDAKGQLLRKSLYKKVRYLDPGQEPAESEFVPSDALIQQYATARPGDTSSRFEPEQLSKLVGFPIRMPKWLPHGYVFRGAYQTPCTCAPHIQAARLEFSDGLNTLTMFECGHREESHKHNCFAGDASTAMTYRYEKPGFSYLAIGDLSKDQLTHLVHSAAD